MAQEQYGFFNSTAGDERSYDSADMAVMLRTLASNGVTDANTCLQVSAEGSTMRTLMGYGAALVEGHYYRLRDDGGGVKAFEHAAEAALDRIDRIVLRLDVLARTVTMQKRIGTAASTPQPPALVRDAETWELSLAQVRIHAGAAEILPADITDERGDEAVCGLIAPESLKRSVLVSLIGQMIDAAVADIDAGYSDVLRHSAQTLDTAQKAQARANIGAQQSVSASGLLKGDGAGGVVSAAEGTDYIGALNGRVHPFRASADVAYYTASITLQLTDAGRLIQMNNPSAATITIPANASVPFDDDAEMEAVMWSAGAVTIVPAPGVTLVSAYGMRDIGVRYGTVALKRMGSTDTWLLTGALK